MKPKRIIPFLCVILLFSILSSTALAYDPETLSDDSFDPTRYSYISSIFVSFDISSAGLSDDYCRVYIPDTSCSCWLDMYLQRWDSDSSTWETIKSWSKYGVETIVLEKEWYVASGYAYRLKCNVSVYDYNNLLCEATSAYSVIIPYGTTYP